MHITIFLTDDEDRIAVRFCLFLCSNLTLEEYLFDHIHQKPYPIRFLSTIYIKQEEHRMAKNERRFKLFKLKKSGDSHSHGMARMSTARASTSSPQRTCNCRQGHGRNGCNAPVTGPDGKCTRCRNNHVHYEHHDESHWH